MKRTYDQQAMKAMVTVYGPREAARKMQIPVGTMTAMASRHKWKKVTHTRGAGTKPLNIDAGDALRESLEQSRDQSTLHLAEYTQKAAKAATEAKDPLSVARKVRDVAGIYSILWPAEEQTELIEGAILIGAAKVVDNPAEILANVRQELPDQRPAGD